MLFLQKQIILDLPKITIMLLGIKISKKFLIFLWKRWTALEMQLPITFIGVVVSKEFHTALQKEAEENDTIVDLPRLEVKENADYDFKLLP